MSATSAASTAELAAMVQAADSVVALTGAGISVPSGIPDFRTPGTGLWANIDPMEVAHIDVFHRDPERFWRFYGHRFQTLEHKRPNRAHEVLAELEALGLLRAVITQNVDQLHRRAGTQELVEVHGSIASSSCLRCGTQYELAEVRERQTTDERGIPRCDCGEPLKPGVVLFGEHLSPAALGRAHELAAGADLLLCIGSSLEVYPVAQLPAVTKAAGGALAIITQGVTPWDAEADLRFFGDVVAELQGLSDELRR